MSEEEPQPEFVHGEAFGKGEGFAHEPADALPGRAEEALGMTGFTSLFGAEPMGMRWKHSLIGKPQVAARGATKIVRRQAFAQPAGALLPSDPQACRQPPGGFCGKEQSRASIRLPSCCPQSSRVHRIRAHRLFGRAEVFREAAATLPPFFSTQRRSVR